jgi:hypothetical protein
MRGWRGIVPGAACNFCQLDNDIPAGRDSCLGLVPEPAGQVEEAAQGRGDHMAQMMMTTPSPPI